MNASKQAKLTTILRYGTLHNDALDNYAQTLFASANFARNNLL